MKTLGLSFFLLFTSIPAFSGTVNPPQGETAMPALYAPQNPVQEEKTIQSQSKSETKSGSKLDFGDYTSTTLAQKAWGSLAAKDLKAVEVYVNKADELYAKKAKEMQMGLKDYASGDNKNIFKYWALNDVGTAWFILGQAYQDAGKKEQATQAYKKVVNEYSFAQCWDPKGWFWKPSEAAQKKLAELGVS